MKSWNKIIKYEENFVFNLSPAFASAAEHHRNFEDGEIYAQALDKSGKCAFRRKGKDGKKRDLNKDAFVIEVDYIKQKCNQGRDVGKPVNSLANQQFNISSFNKSASYQGKVLEKLSYFKVAAKTSSMQASLARKA